ncbi:MAG: DHH family phosphoesterase [gamma proteobacterium symbiont of Bathyaustriella thionipta]|nr:DHH family phosphoesterase [gamma proteobacterium symbiont of Bathyaustriella thionipta]MCU7951459.1 DHH family phosphoesterase [gamma proteobacterium symbiont of Bathyaustriella thionipta]MCU7954880.1 DHH family phosphoesterase [gamma proteobacterium symbiont of Bathyaustriella thionipta]MCU7958021.1 DHH family phosphoesterase [gamma proteobacterium symbiont of Bathyaustriella thionipta]MCU7966850.1 DHH family phosphoesterase [gamma proteobacterium symbiont of Bathyaustriella thionipta]
MTIYDIFNGDADGICALLQLRHTTPCQSELITGIKRDIKLLEKVNAVQDDTINVLDVSLDKNRSDLLRNLKNGAEVFYVDHHFCGDIPDNKKLTTLIDTQPDTCTSLLINQHLQDKQPLWAITGAFGDNLNVSAQTLANKHQLKQSDMTLLKSLGIYINYNGYGASIDDLHFAPDELFKKFLPYQNPLDAIQDSNSVYQELKSGYEEDNLHVSNLKAEYKTDKVALFILPDETWARRISGVYSNELVNQFPDRAHAVLTQNSNNGYLISVRAPLNNKTGADELCRQFESGGGRKAAAGVNHLPKSELQIFIDKFVLQFK